MSSVDSENTTSKHSGLKPWKPGQSGNPKGKPKGSRHKLGEAFIEAMHDDFLTNGKEVIEKVRLEKPDQYLKVIASILPKELNVKTGALDELEDSELAGLLDAVRTVAANLAAREARGREETPGSEQQTPVLPPVH